MKVTNLRQKGFTLLEIMIAMTVLMVGLLGLWRITAQNFNSSHWIFQRYLALRQVDITKPLVDKNFSTPGFICYGCDITGLCQSLNCNDVNASSWWMPLRVEWQTENRVFNLMRSVTQLGGANSTIDYTIVTVTAGWGGSNATGCIQDIDACTNNVTIKKAKFN